MSMLFFDGFDGYDGIADAYNYGGWSQVNFYGVNLASVGRSGSGKGVALTADHTMGYSLGSAFSGKTWYIGFAMKIVSNTTSGIVIEFQETLSSSRFVTQCFLHYNNLEKKLELKKGDYTYSTVLATSSMSLIEDTWYYIEVKFLCDSVSGVFELKTNESVVASYTGNTQYKATDNIASIYFGGFITADINIDDVYILNSDGAINNTYLGDVQCTLTYPSADYSTTFTPTGAVSNYLCVDDFLGNPDEDTTYVSSSTVGNIDEYSLPNIVASEVHAVKVNTRAMKDDVNPRNMKHGIRTGTKANETEYVLGEGYGNYIDVYDDQGDGTPWDETSFNAARSMIKVQS